MGGKGGGGQLPDYAELIRDSAYYNRNTQITPSGGLFWSPDRTTAAQVLSPEAQAQLDLRNTLAQYALGSLGGGFLGITPEMMNSAIQVPWYQQPGSGVSDLFGGSDPFAGLSPEERLRLLPEMPEEMWDDIGREFSGGAFGGGGGAGTPDLSLMPEGWGNRIDPTQFLSGPFEGLGFDPEGEEFLKAMLGSGAGGGAFSVGGGGGGGMSLAGLADLVKFGPDGTPNIGPGTAHELNLGELPEFADVGGLFKARDRAEKSAFDRAMMLINPELAKRKTAMEEELMNRGITGGDIRNEMMRDYDLSSNQALTMAALDAVGSGREEYKFLSDEAKTKRAMTLNERLTQANLQNQVQELISNINLGAYSAEANARYQQGSLAEAAAGRRMQGKMMDMQNKLAAAAALWGRDMNEYNTAFGNLAMLAGFGGQQGMNYSLGAPVDVTGASNAAMNNAMYNFQSSPFGMGMELAGTLGSAFLMSDVRLKKNIVQINGESVVDKIRKLPIYKWNYANESDEMAAHIGPMAQDFNEKFGTPGTLGEIAVIDAVSANGILLAAVQELAARVEELEKKGGE